MKPKLPRKTITAIRRVINGDSDFPGGPLGPYRSGPALVEFFNELGFDDVYQYKGGFPSRWSYVEGRLSELNGNEGIVKAIEAALDPTAFVDTALTVEKAAEYLNQYLAFDGLVLTSTNRGFRLRTLGEPAVVVETSLEPERRASHEFIAEQIAKCDRKLQDEDYDGAITNARSAVEAVLCDIESRLDSSPPDYDGDLGKLFKRVQKLLNLDPDRKDINDSLRQLLRGLVSIIGGLAPLRNKMGDAHVRRYKPARHHAKLAVNAAKTVLDFVFDTFEYQKNAGKLKEVASDPS